jgi:hypothetical protein
MFTSNFMKIDAEVKGEHVNMTEYYHFLIQTKSSDCYLDKTAPDQLAHSSHYFTFLAEHSDSY